LRFSLDSNAPEYHPRQWVDRSSPTYAAGALVLRSPNTTHGSGWIVQARPTPQAAGAPLPNTSHGSGWIVQARPTPEARWRSAVFPSLSPRAARGERGREKWNPRRAGLSACRLCM